MPGYSKVQCIAYEVNTFPEIIEGLSKSTGTTTTVKIGDKTYTLPVWDVRMVYLGDRLPSIDIFWRCELMKHAILHTSRSNYIDQSTSTLKIFMAPEFYFRGYRGAYAFDDYQDVVERLRKMVEGDRWKDWLFVFGTVLATWEDPQDKKLINNVALLQKGGPGGWTRAVVKELKSHIDFIGNPGVEKVKNTHVYAKPKTRLGALQDSDVEHPQTGKPTLGGWSSNTGAGKEHQKYEYDGRGIFTEDGITFGVEICRDHLKQRLRKSPPEWSQGYVQVQLITSAGASIKAESTVAIKGGIVFNCDGNKRSDVKQVDQPASGSSQNATFGTQKVTALDTVDLPKGPMTEVFKRYYTGDDAKVNIYEPLTLPKAVTRTALSWSPYSV